MERLKLILEKHSRWQPLDQYVTRIEGFRQTDFSICVENSKSLLESIAKEICTQKRQPLTDEENVSKLLKLAFGCLGYQPTKTISQIGQAIANIGQQMGVFRNDIGTTSHGKTLDELKNRTNLVNSLTDDFLLISTELVCCFLIEAFESDNPLAPIEPEIEFDENLDFNEFWDEQYGEFEMGDYSFLPSEILYKLDPLAYKSELNTFQAMPDDSENGE
jgi:Abortive infection C-terminus